MPNFASISKRQSHNAPAAFRYLAILIVIVCIKIAPYLIGFVRPVACERGEVLRWDCGAHHFSTADWSHSLLHVSFIWRRRFSLAKLRFYVRSPCLCTYKSKYHTYPNYKPFYICYELYDQSSWMFRFKLDCKDN